MNIFEELTERYTYNGAVSLKAIEDDIVTLENQIDNYNATLNELRLRRKNQTPLNDKIREAKIHLSILKAFYKKETDRDTSDDVILNMLGVSAKSAKETDSPETVASDREPKPQNFIEVDAEKNTDENEMFEDNVLIEYNDTGCTSNTIQENITENIDKQEESVVIEGNKDADIIVEQINTDNVDLKNIYENTSNSFIDSGSEKNTEIYSNDKIYEDTRYVSLPGNENNTEVEYTTTSTETNCAPLWLYSGTTYIKGEEPIFDGGRIVFQDKEEDNDIETNGTEIDKHDSFEANIVSDDSFRYTFPEERIYCPFFDMQDKITYTLDIHNFTDIISIGRTKCIIDFGCKTLTVKFMDLSSYPLFINLLQKNTSTKFLSLKRFMRKNKDIFMNVSVTNNNNDINFKFQFKNCKIINFIDNLYTEDDHHDFSVIFKYKKGMIE